MCCRTVLQGCAVEAEELDLVMRVAGFNGLPVTGVVTYRRDLGPTRYVNAHVSNYAGLYTVSFALEPTIGGHTLDEHRNAGQGAAILFKVAQTLGERGGGIIVQQSLMGLCRHEGKEKVIADYPKHPLLFSNLCSGFRQDLMHGVEQLTPLENQPD